MDINSSNLTARLTRDAELRSTPQGTSVCSLRVAYTQPSERQPTGYVDVEVWGKYGESCAQLQKGARVGISGELRFSEWMTAEGQKRSGLSIRADKVIFLSAKPSGDEEPASEAPVAA